MKWKFIVNLFWLLIFWSPVYGQEQETITIITYYPAPYGRYGYIRSDKMAVGKNSVSPSTTEATFLNINVPSVNTFTDRKALVQIGDIPSLAGIFGIYCKSTDKLIEEEYFSPCCFYSRLKQSTATSKFIIGYYSLLNSKNDTFQVGQSLYGIYGNGDSASSYGIYTKAIRNTTSSGNSSAIGIYGISADYGIYGYGTSSGAKGINVQVIPTTSTTDIYGINAYANLSGNTTDVILAYGAYGKAELSGTLSSGETWGDTYGIKCTGGRSESSTSETYGLFIDTSWGGADCGIYTEVESGSTTSQCIYSNRMVEARGEKFGISAYALYDSTTDNERSFRGVGTNKNFPDMDAKGLYASGYYKGLESYAYGSGEYVYGIYASGTTYGGYFNAPTVPGIAGKFKGRVLATQSAGVGGKALHYETSDIAEIVLCKEPIDYGEVVEISEETPYDVELAKDNYSSNVAGVISENPLFKFGDIDNTKQVENGSWKYLALAGQVYVKADADYGEIKPGDLLTISPTPGHVMKAKEYVPGTIVGKSLGSLKKGRGRILIFVTLM